jgi:hypothetical protein
MYSFRFYFWHIQIWCRYAIANDKGRAIIESAARIECATLDDRALQKGVLKIYKGTGICPPRCRKRQEMPVAERME